MTPIQARCVRVELVFFTVAHVERQLDRLLEDLEDVTSLWQELLMGIEDSWPLCGEELIARWQTRLHPFPEPLRRAMIKAYWDFFPLWYHHEAMAARDGEL